MAYPISQFKSDLEPMLHGTTLDEVPNIDNVIFRAARQLLLDCDPNETIRTEALASSLFDDVFIYTPPTDLKGSKIIDIKPQVNRDQNSYFTQSFNRNFDATKKWNYGPQFNVDFNQMVKTLLIDKDLTSPVILNQAEDTTDNGTWAVTSPATTLTVDNINYVNGNGSLMFNLASGANPSTGYLENSTMTATDLTDYLSQGTLFVWVYLPTASNFTSISLRWGSDSSNYYSKSATTTQGGTSFVDGWNLLSFPWISASTTGTPDVENIDYIRVSYTYNGTAMSNVRLNGITCQLGTIYEIQYYSKYLFRNASTGAFQEQITDDSDLINLDVESYNLLLDCTCMMLAQQLQGQNGQFDYSVMQKNYKDNVARYVAQYKSQIIKPFQNYYKKQNNSYRRWFGFLR